MAYFAERKLDLDAQHVLSVIIESEWAIGIWVNEVDDRYGCGSTEVDAIGNVYRWLVRAGMPQHWKGCEFARNNAMRWLFEVDIPPLKDFTPEQLDDQSLVMPSLPTVELAAKMTDEDLVFRIRASAGDALSVRLYCDHENPPRPPEERARIDAFWDAWKNLVGILAMMRGQTASECEAKIFGETWPLPHVSPTLDQNDEPEDADPRAEEVTLTDPDDVPSTPTKRTKTLWRPTLAELRAAIADVKQRIADICPAWRPPLLFTDTAANRPLLTACPELAALDNGSGANSTIISTRAHGTTIRTTIRHGTRMKPMRQRLSEKPTEAEVE